MPCVGKEPWPIRGDPEGFWPFFLLLLLIANRAFYRGDGLELVLGILEFTTQSTILGLDGGQALVYRRFLGALCAIGRCAQPACFRAEHHEFLGRLQVDRRQRYL